MKEEPLVKKRQNSSVKRCEDVVALLKRDILMRKYQPGDALPCEEVQAQTYGVSRAMVREALGILKTNGFIESRRGKNGGTFVKNIIESDRMGDFFRDLILMGRMRIEDLVSARLLIEPEAVRLAALNASTVELQQLSDINELVKSARTQSEKNARNVAFHIKIGEMSGNPFYAVSIRSFMSFTQRFTEMVGSSLPDIHDDKAHEALLESLLVRDPQLSYERMFVHVSNMKAAMASQEKLFRDANLF